MKYSQIIASSLTALLFFSGCSNVESQREETFTWKDLPELPHPSGLSGAFAGASNGALIVAGGADSPSITEWKSESNTWYDSIYVLVDDEQDEWLGGYKLKAPLAYGASVIRDNNLILIGGRNAEGNQDQVTRLTWNAESQMIEQESLPPLPHPVSFIDATLVSDTLFVAGGKVEAEESKLSKIFWSLNLLNLEAGWNSLDPWDGPARTKAKVVRQNTGDKSYVYLLGGEGITQDKEGDLQTQSLTDGYRYSLRQKIWERIADTPHPTTAAPVINYGQSHIIIFGGRHVGENEKLKHSSDLLAYHTITDTWLVKGEIPHAVANAEAVPWEGGFVLVSGELSSGENTPWIQFMKHESGEKASFGVVNYTFLILYLSILVLMGLYFSKREKGTEDYFLAGRRIPWWAAAISMLGTGLSALTYIATPALLFATDWFMFPASIGAFIVPIIIIYFYLPFFRRLNITTVYEYLELRFNVAVRLFGSVQFIIFQLIRISLILYLPAIVLSTITGINIYVCILSMGLLSTFYTALGGIEAVIWSDVLQVIIFFIGIFFAIITVTLHVDGGVMGVFEIGMANDKFRMLYLDWDLTTPTIWVVVLGGVFRTIVVLTSDQSRIQRFLTTKDEKSAAKGLWLNAIIGIPTAIVFYVMGSALYAYFKTHPTGISLGMQNDAIFPLYIAQTIPIGLAGFLIAAIFSAAMSSLDSGMNSISTVFVTDIYRRFLPDKPEHSYFILARRITLLSGITASAIALMMVSFDIKSATLFSAAIVGLFSSGLAGLFALGIFTRRAKGIGALIGAIASALFLYFIKFHTPIHFFLYTIIGFFICLIVGYLASLIIPEKEKPLDGLTLYTLNRKKENNG